MRDTTPRVAFREAKIRELVIPVDIIMVDLRIFSRLWIVTTEKEGKTWDWCCKCVSAARVIGHSTKTSIGDILLHLLIELGRWSGSPKNSFVLRDPTTQRKHACAFYSTLWLDSTRRFTAGNGRWLYSTRWNNAHLLAWFSTFKAISSRSKVQTSSSSN